MANIGTFTSNQRGNRPSIPGDLHPESCAQEAKTEKLQSRPNQNGKQILLVPRIEIIPAHLPTPEDKVLLEKLPRRGITVQYPMRPQETSGG